MHDDWTPELKEAIALAGVSRQETADALRVSISTVNAWLKPATSKSANPTPMWAVELFRYKFKGRLALHAASQKN
jgi:transposase-like protein